MPEAADAKIAAIPEEIALPRKNGELVFESPWEARAFGLAVALNQSGVYPWRDFSRGLAEQVARAEREGVDSTYYVRWLQALEQLILEEGLATPAELKRKCGAVQREDDHGHDHDHDHDHHETN